MKYIKPIKLDNINLLEKDFLQNSKYSEQLKDMVEDYYSSNTMEPLYIGVIGEWGSGKSTIVKTTLSQLHNVKIFEYDAWKYEDDGFRRTFIKQMLNQSNIKKLSDTYVKINNSLYEDYSISSNSIIERIRLSREKDKNYKTPKDYIVAIIIIILVLITGYLTAKEYNSILGALFSTLASIGFFNILYSSTTYSKSKLFSPEQFYLAFKEILKKSKGKNNLIFIDNLDRCEGENLILTLKCIRGFYMEKNDNMNEKIVFIIPLDNNSLNKAYNVTDSNYYLDKIFDNIIYLKQINITDKLDFINCVLKEYPDIEDILPMNVREVLICADVRTPREIIKLINDYVIEYMILEKNKGTKFVEASRNRKYLMKSVILNKKYYNFYQLAFNNITELISIEHKEHYADEIDEFKNTYGKDCINFLNKTKNVFPEDYYEFYNNQNKKPYSLPYDIEEALDLQDIDMIKKYNNKQQIINHFANGIHYYINFELWDIKIANRFIVFLKLANEEYFTKEEIKQVISSWDSNLFREEQFYEMIIYARNIGFDELIKFVKIANPNKYFTIRLLEGIKNGKFSDDKETKLIYYSKIFSANILETLLNKGKEMLNQYIKDVIEEGLYKEENYLDVINTPLVKEIELDNIKLIINRIDNESIDILNSIIESFKKYNIKCENELVECLIYYLNRFSSYIIKYNEMMNILMYIINEDCFKEKINTLNITFNYDEEETDSYITNFIKKYIELDTINTTFNNFVKKHKLQSNINKILEIFDNNIDVLSEDFIDYYIKYIELLNNKILSDNISKIINLYNKCNTDEFINILKDNGLLKEVYDNLKSSEKKEKFVENAITNLSDFEEKIDNMFLYESASDRFNTLIEKEYTLLNILQIMKHTEKSGNIQLSIDKIISILRDKDNITNEELNNLIEIINLDKINKNESKKIIKVIIDKLDKTQLLELSEKVIITDKRLLEKIEEKLNENI